MLSKEEIKANVLAQKIYRVQEYILEEIKQNGEISQFKEDILYIIHNLLERQLDKKEMTACEIVAKNQEARIRAEKEKQLQRKINQLESREQKLIEKLEEDIVNITKTMQDGKHCDDYSRCRLKAYRTKTKEILEILK